MNGFPIKCILWGSGQYAKAVMQHIQWVNNSLSKRGAESIYELKEIVDSSLDKQGTFFMGHRIISPHVATWNEYDVIVAVRNHGEIDGFLENKEHGNIYYLEGVLAEIPVIDRIDQLDFGSINIDYQAKIRSIYSLIMHIKSGNDLEAWIENEDSFVIGEKVGAIACLNHDQIEKSQLINNNTKTILDGFRVAMITPRLSNGGAERVVSELLQILSDSTEYDLYCICEEGSDEHEYVLPSRVKKTYIGTNPQKNVWTWIVSIYNFLLKNRITVLISHESFNLYNYYLGFMCKQMGIRFIIEYHNSLCLLGNDIDKFQLCYQMSDAVVTLSNSVKAYWESKGVKAVYIPNPISKINEVDCDIEPNYILWIGRIAQFQKNVLAVVPVMERIKQIRPSSVLHIVGKESELGIEKKLRNQIRKKGLEDVIVFEGYRSSVEEFYCKASVMMMTSEFEGFPMTIIESKQVGLPVVMYKLDDIELLKDGKGYIAVDNGDTNSMAEKIVAILDDQDFRRRLSVEAKESLTPFWEYDIVSAWRNVIEDIAI